MNENIRRFMEIISADEALRSKVETLQQESAENMEAQLIALAAEHGIELHSGELISSQKQELSDDELDAVAGGVWCWCSFGGSGLSDDNENECVCLMGGTGTWTSEDDRCNCSSTGTGISDNPKV